MTAISWFPPNTYIASASVQVPADVNIWLNDFFTHLNALDWTQTADTGQYIIGSTNAYSNLATNGGPLAYQIYRFNDQFSSTYPLYVKVQLEAQFGNKTTGFTIGSTITVGTATDGAGNITTNAVSQGIGAGYPATRDVIAASYQSFATTIPDRGFICIIFNAGRQHQVYDMKYAPVAFCIERIPNDDGTPSNKGFSLFCSGLNYNSNNPVNNDGNFGNVNVCFAKTMVFTTNQTYTYQVGVPYFPQTTFVSGALINHFYHSTPMPIRSSCVGAILSGRLGKGTQFTATIYGNTPTNFIAMDGFCAFRPMSIANTNLVFAFE